MLHWILLLLVAYTWNRTKCPWQHLIRSWKVQEKVMRTYRYAWWYLQGERHVECILKALMVKWWGEGPSATVRPCIPFVIFNWYVLKYESIIGRRMRLAIAGVTVKNRCWSNQQSQKEQAVKELRYCLILVQNSSPSTAVSRVGDLSLLKEKCAQMWERMSYIEYSIGD